MAPPPDHEFNDSESHSVAAAQVVFANLEAPESPHGERGFQIACFTQPDLDLETIRVEIEPALFYYRRSGYDIQQLPSESVFFRTKSGRVVLVRITPVFDDFDMYGRPKTLFAHALVFDAEPFRVAFQNNPFPIFDSHPFLRSYKEVLDRGGGRPKNSRLDQVWVTRAKPGAVAESRSFRALRSNPVQLRLMLLLASHASNPRERRYTLQCDGPAGSLFDFMRDLMRLLPPSQRVACSFDTLFVGDDGSRKASQSPHWANGVAKDQSLGQQGTVRFQLESGQFLVEEGFYSPETPYESWLASAFKAEWSIGDAVTANTLRAACTLQELCWGRSCPEADIQAVPNHVFRDFLKINEAYIRRLLLKNLQKCPGAAVADNLITPAMQWITDKGPAGLYHVTRRFPRERFVEWLLPEYWACLPPRVPNDDELLAIEKALALEESAAEANDDSRLLACLLWVWRRDWKQLALTAELLSREAYQRLVRRVLETIEFQSDINVSVAPNTGALGFYTFVNGASRKILPQALTAALLGFALQKVAPAVEGKAAPSQPVFKRVGKAGRQRWDVVVRALRTLATNRQEWQLAMDPLQLGFGRGRSQPVEAPRTDLRDELLTAKKPPIAGELIKLIARYRLSAGLWRRQELCVTPQTGFILEGDIEKLCGQLVCLPSQYDQPAHVYFTIPLATVTLAVVARITRVSDEGADPEIYIQAFLTDQASFLAKYANNPFQLISSVIFHHKIPEPESATRPLQPKVVQLLLQFAAHASSPQPSPNYTLVLRGSSNAAYSLFERLFALLPRELRRVCTFHTCFMDKPEQRMSSKKAKGYFGIGLPNGGRDDDRDEVPFNLNEDRFVDEFDLGETELPFELWIRSAIDGRLLAEPTVQSQIEEAYLYDCLFRGQHRPLPEAAGPAYPSFIEAIRPLIFKRLPQDAGGPYAAVFGRRLLRWIQKQHPRWLAEVGPRQFDSNWIIDWTVAALTEVPRHPSHEAVKGIEYLVPSYGADSSPASILHLMCRRWHCDWDKLAGQVGLLDVETYPQFAAWCVKTLAAETEIPFVVEWVVRFDHQGHLQFGPMLTPSHVGREDDYSESRALLAALLGRVVTVPVFVNQKQSKAVIPPPEVVSQSATRLLPELLKVLQDHAHPGGSG